MKERRILITHDNDFKNPFLFPKGSFYGIIILNSTKQGKKAVKIFFEHFLNFFSLNEAKGKIIIVEENQIRIRELISKFQALPHKFIPIDQI